MKACLFAWLLLAFCGPAAWAGEDDSIEVLTGTAAVAEPDSLTPAASAGGEQARSLVEKAGKEGDLEQARKLLGQALALDPAGPSGAKAALELSEMDYAQGLYRQALDELDKVRSGDEADYWRGQCFLMMKDYSRAREAFGTLLRRPEESYWTGLARLGAADCDLAEGDTASAYAGYKILWTKDSPVAAQALWQGARIQERLGNTPAARALYQDLARGFKGTFEGGKAALRMAGLDSPPASPVPAGPLPAPAATRARPHYTVQIAAYSQARSAEEMARKLRKRRYKVTVRQQRLDVTAYYEVCVGRYATREEAKAAARKISRREQVPYLIKLLP